MDDNMLDTVCSSLRPLIKDVLNAKIGICARDIELVQVSSGKPASEKKINLAIGDRFKLKIPISDQYLSWEVVFNCAFPNCPPDFDLQDPDFFGSVTLDSMEELLPSFNNWDHTKEKAMINVISELRSAYLKYQVDKLDEIEPRWAYEYSTLISDSRVPGEQVEVFVDTNVVHFLIKLDVDLTLILPHAVMEDYIIALGVRCGTLSAARATILITSPNVVKLIGINLELHRNIKCDDNLLEYAAEVSSAIADQVLTLVMKRQQKRKQFIFELLMRLGKSVISYDALEYNNANFLLEKDNFVCVMDISLPPLFPSKPPQCRLLSAYSTEDSGQPLARPVALPFSETWDTRTMVDQALSVIMSKTIQKFKESTIPLFQAPK